MSSDNDPIIREDARRVRELAIAFVEDYELSSLLMRIAGHAIAALPKREAAPAKPAPVCERWVCQLHGHYSCGCEKRWLCECGKAASQHGAAPHEGEPPGLAWDATPRETENSRLLWMGYARQQRERAVRAEAEREAARERLTESLRLSEARAVQRDAALDLAEGREAELAKAREACLAIAEEFRAGAKAQIAAGAKNPEYWAGRRSAASDIAAAIREAAK